MTRPTARVLLLASFLFAPHALAQPGGPPPRPQDEPLAGPDVANGSRAEIGAVLRARLLRLEGEQAALEQSLADLEAGREITWPAEDRGRRARDGERDGRAFGDRFRDRSRDGGPGDEPREPITEAQQAQISAFLKEHDPRMLERFSEMGARNPEFAERMMQRFGHRTLRLIGLETEDPEEFARRLQSMKAQGSIRETLTEAIKNGTLDAPETREKISAMVTASMDLQEAEHEDEINDLAERIAHLRERQTSERENRSARLEQMVDRVIERAHRFRDGGPGEPSRRR